MEDKKKSNVGVVLLVIILMIGCLCGGYFLSYSDVFKVNTGQTLDDKNEKNKKEAKGESAYEVLDVTSEEVRDYVNKTISAHGYYCGFYKLYEGSKVAPNDLENTDISKMVLNEVLKNKNTTKEGDTYTKKEFDDAAAKLFGKDFKFTHQTIETCPSFTYDEANGVYTEGSHNCGGTCGPSNIFDAVKAIKTNDGMEIYVRMLFYGGNKNISDMNYYKDYQLSNKIDFTANDSHRLLFDYSTYLGQGTLYKLSYGLEDGNYYFISSEIVNQ